MRKTYSSSKTRTSQTITRWQHFPKSNKTRSKKWTINLKLSIDSQLSGHVFFLVFERLAHITYTLSLSLSLSIIVNTDSRLVSDNLMALLTFTLDRISRFSYHYVTHLTLSVVTNGLSSLSGTLSTTIRTFWNEVINLCYALLLV